MSFFKKIPMENDRKPTPYFKNWQIKTETQIFILPSSNELYQWVTKYSRLRETSLYKIFPVDRWKTKKERETELEYHHFKPK